MTDHDARTREERVARLTPEQSNVALAAIQVPAFW
jgi:hypothetical protein